jgi:hypothetical protein
MIANMSAFALARHWRHTSIYEALLEQDGIQLSHSDKFPRLPRGAPLLPSVLPTDTQT